MILDKTDGDCAAGSKTANALVRRAHEFEVCRLFPALLARFPSPSEFEEVLDRLKFEHGVDEDFAEQVYHQIREFIVFGKHGLAEQLASTQRDFFQNMRQHVKFECEFLLPVARECPEGAALTAAADIANNLPRYTS